MTDEIFIIETDLSNPSKNLEYIITIHSVSQQLLKEPNLKSVTVV